MGAGIEFLHPAWWRDWMHAGVDQLGAAPFWLAALRIVFINTILSGDNAVVIAMACRGLPPHQQRWGLVIGVSVAVLLRVLFAGVISRLMLMPYVELIGGVALLVIAARLLVPDSKETGEVDAAAHLWRAIWIVVAADVIMSLDNIVAIAAAAEGDVLLLAIGLAVSIPLVMVGAALITGLVERFPVLVWAGVALLGWVAGDAIIADPAMSSRLAVHFGAQLFQQFQFAAPATGAVLAIAGGGLWRSRYANRVRPVGEHRAA